MSRLSASEPRKNEADALGRSRAAAVMTRELIEQIRDGALPPGSLIMSGPVLAKRYGISYQTVVRALADLVERGWLVRQHGRGTYVSPTPPLENIAEAAARTVLVALDPRSLTRGRFGFAIVEALDESLVHAGLRIRYAPLSAAGESSILEEFAGGEGDVSFLVALDRPDFLAKALTRRPGLPALALHALPGEHDIPPGARYDAVLVDDRPGGFGAGELLLRHGHARIAYLGGPPDDARAQERGTGLREALARERLKPAAEAWAANWDELSGREAARALLKKLAKGAKRSEPFAVFCANDRLAHGFYEAAAEAGLRIPEQASVVGFDDQEIAAQLVPPLTTMRIDRGEYGRQAAILVRERFAEPQRPPRIVRMPVAAVERASVRGGD